MAIFYPHIKGGAVDTDSSSTTKIKYSWIRFNGDGHNPQLYISKLNNTDYNEDHAVDCGYLITSKTANIFDEDQRISLGKRLIFSSQDSQNQDNSFSILVNGSKNLTLSRLSNNTWTDYLYLTDAALFVYKHLTMTGILTVGTVSNASVANSLYVQGNIYSLGNGGCNALFFNATSDKRAKTDIHYLNIDALSLINQVRLYGFKYKNTNEPSIGVIAQDLKDIDIQGFNLVDNINASGVDGDYMRIKESKLVYILWKGIQELTTEVKNLKNEINELKNKKD